MGLSWRHNSLSTERAPATLGGCLACAASSLPRVPSAQPRLLAGYKRMRTGSRQGKLPGSNVTNDRRCQGLSCPPLSYALFGPWKLSLMCQWSRGDKAMLQPWPGAGTHCREQAFEQTWKTPSSRLVLMRATAGSAQLWLCSSVHHLASSCWCPGSLCIGSQLQLCLAQTRSPGGTMMPAHFEYAPGGHLLLPRSGHGAGIGMQSRVHSCRRQLRGPLVARAGVQSEQRLVVCLALLLVA